VLRYSFRYARYVLTALSTVAFKLAVNQRGQRADCHSHRL
jgi:hypothetical protein